MSMIAIFITVIVSAAMLGIVGFIANPDLMKAIFGDGRIYEITYQFLLITVIGGSIAWLFKEFDRIRGHRAALRDMHVELLQAYNRAKTVRRELRAKLGTVITADPDIVVVEEDYIKQMQKLSEAQLTFEIYAKRSKDPKLWFKDAKALADSLGKLESYLNKIIKEYQRECAKFTGDPPVRRLGDLPMLKEFVGPSKQSIEFKKMFQYPVREALQSLGRVMLR